MSAAAPRWNGTRRPGAILWRAGGCVVDSRGEALRYRREDRGYRNGPFAALGDPLSPRACTPAGGRLSGHGWTSSPLQGVPALFAPRLAMAGSARNRAGSHRCDDAETSFVHDVKTGFASTIRPRLIASAHRAPRRGA